MASETANRMMANNVQKTCTDIVTAVLEPGVHLDHSGLST